MHARSARAFSFTDGNELNISPGDNGRSIIRFPSAGNLSGKLNPSTTVAFNNERKQWWHDASGENLRCGRCAKIEESSDDGDAP